jgi:hypothetical protein
MADGAKLLRLLKRVHLGGIIEEAVVDLDSYSVQAVDITNSLFVKVSEEGDVDGIGAIGIGNLSLVCKYLDTFKGEVSLSQESNRLIIASKGRGKLKYLTTDPEFIPTAVKEGDIETLLEPCVGVVELEKAACVDVSTYFGLIKPKSAKFSFNAKTKEVVLDSGLESDHQFTLPIGKGKVVEGAKVSSSFSIEVYSAQIDAIFSVLDWPGKHKPSLFMAPEHPIVIQQDENNMWALLPLAPTKEE